MDFIVGQRYTMTKQDAYQVMKQLWPAVTGEPDLSRGRVFDKAPCDWHFWTKEGKRVDFSFKPGQHLIGSVSNEVDKDILEPLTKETA